MRIVAISDTHTHRGIAIPDGDVLIHAGDVSSTGTPDQVERFLAWFDSQPHRHKIFIAGNHDWLFERSPAAAEGLLSTDPGITYLQDSGLEIDGVHFWGSPWQPAFNSLAFNLPRKGPRLRAFWNKIPTDTDVLITHGPPHGILDQVRGGEHLGCEELAIRLAVVKPRIHIFGHIHDSYGVIRSAETLFVNASTCDEDFRPVNRPVVVDLLPDRIVVPGVEANQRQQAIEAIASHLAKVKDATGDDRAAALQLAMEGMSRLRGVPVSALAEDYLVRGLSADSAAHNRKESKPSRRPIPYRTQS